MTARITATLVRHDLRLQRRYGLWLAYAFVTAFYAVILLYAAPVLPTWVVGLVIYTDPAALGFFFLGALMMLERSEGCRTALAVTPVSAAAYFWSKAITLTAVCLVVVAVLGLLAGRPVDWGLLLLACSLTSVCFVGLGVPVARLFRTVTGYLLGAAAIFTPLLLPMFLALLEPMPAWAMLLPPAAQLRLILLATGDGSAGAPAVALMLAVTALAAAGGAWLGIRSLRDELGR